MLHRIFGFRLFPMEGDGNCLMRTFSHQFWVTQDHHELIRRVAYAQLHSRPDLYDSDYTDEEYNGILTRCKSLNCPAPPVAIKAIADVFQVDVIILYSYSRIPIMFIHPQDPDSRSRQVFYLSITMDSLEDPYSHCDSIVPMHYPVHEPMIIPQKVMSWMKQHGISISEDRLLQCSTFSHGQTSLYDLRKRQRSSPGEEISEVEKQLEQRRRLNLISDEDIIRESRAITAHLEPLPVISSIEARREMLHRVFGFRLFPMERDANCLMRAMSHQFWVTQEHHEFLRRIAYAQLRSRPDLYSSKYTDEEYKDILTRCRSINCPAPLLACVAIADVFQVLFLVLVSYEENPINFYKRDPKSRTRQVFYLSITKESLEDPDFHCDSVLPMHYHKHEPIMIPQMVMTWMKRHGISISEDHRLVQSSTSSYDHTKRQGSPPGESAESKTYEGAFRLR